MGQGLRARLRADARRGQQATSCPENVAPSVAAAVAAETEGISAFERGEIVRGVFLEPKTPYVSRVLLALNVRYFAYGALDPASQTPGLSVEAYLSGSGVTTDEVLRKLGALGRNEVFPKQDAISNARPRV